MKVSGLFSARLSTIGPKLSLTGIYKQPVEHVDVDQLGIMGDVQGDKRVHGGPEKALHQFSWASYQKIIQHYPLLHRQAWPGAMGENISVATMHEDSVCIGDVYAVGSCLLQISAPRIPCWKIDAKFKQPGLSQFIAKHQLSGWYYRVIQTGAIQLDDKLTVVERFNPRLTIRRFLAITQLPKHDAAALSLIEQAVGLDPQWRLKLIGA